MIPNSGCDQNGAPTRPSHSRSVVPVPQAASLLPVPSHVRPNATNGPVSELRPRSSPRPRCPPCPDPAAATLQSAGSRRSPDNGRPGRRPPPPQSASAAPRWPATPTTAAAAPAGKPADVPSADPVDETPRASPHSRPIASASLAEAGSRIARPMAVVCPHLSCNQWDRP